MVNFTDRPDSTNVNMIVYVMLYACGTIVCDMESYRACLEVHDFALHSRRPLDQHYEKIRLDCADVRCDGLKQTNL